jgi:hypothetical protein
LTREYQPFHPTPLLIRNIIKKKLKKKKKGRRRRKKERKKEGRKEGYPLKLLEDNLLEYRNAL